MFISIIIFTTTILLVPIVLVGCVKLTYLAVDASDKMIRHNNKNSESFYISL